MVEPVLSRDLNFGLIARAETGRYRDHHRRGYGEKVSRELPKLKLRVRFSLPAPLAAKPSENFSHGRSHLRDFFAKGLASADFM